MTRTWRWSRSKAMVAALDRVAEVAALGLGSLNLDLVPQRRVLELARWGMAGKAPALRRHPYSRKLAKLLATVVYLRQGRPTMPSSCSTC